MEAIKLVPPLNVVNCVVSTCLQRTGLGPFTHFPLGPLTEPGLTCTD